MEFNWKSFFLIEDFSNGLEKVLKVAAAPANISNAFHEHEVLQRLNKKHIVGVPKTFRFYNNISKYNPHKFTAMLRQYVDADGFDECLRGREVYEHLDELAYQINKRGVSLPRDFNERNVRVDKEGQPWIIDYEESRISDISYWNVKGNYEKLFSLFLGNIQETWGKSKNPLFKFLSNSPEVLKIAAELFYEGPVKRN